MGFSNKQLRLLQRALAAQHIRTRTANGRDLKYIEGWHAIAEANRIFGFDGWDRETLEARCVLARERAGTFLAVYVAKVRITVRVSGAMIVREGNGTGEARAGSPGEVHDMALKTAETDATKRALATFGKPFGLSLYLSPRIAEVRAPTKVAGSDSPSSRYVAQPEKQRVQSPAPANNNTGTDHKSLGDPAGLVVRHDTMYGQNSGDISEDARKLSGQSVTAKQAAETPAQQLSPAPLNDGSGRIDKNALALGEPRRLRDKVHLLFVASQPCLICGRQPSDPHHLRFTQPRAMGRKVSDEFTVPLCRIHHRAAHHTGNEAAWWEDLDINVVEIARSLWQESHDNRRSLPR